MPATLFLVSTPIGNLEDITLRALRVLKSEVQKIACEDTRKTLKLLTHFQIVKPLVSYHEHNEAERTEELMSALDAGESIALVSDAGTPLISDPGYRLVRAAIEKGHPVIPLPGASAILASLAGAGMPMERFRFIGFLPSKESARRREIQALVHEPSTTVLYESPHRVMQTLTEIEDILKNRPVVLARELTKIHEEFLRGTAASVRGELERRGNVKGEITLVIGRADPEESAADPAQEVYALEQDLGLSRMEAIKLVAKRHSVSKGEIYKLVSVGR